MKTLIKSAIIGIALAGVAQAETATQNATNTINNSGVQFSFAQFNPIAGTLSAVDLIFNSSLAGGNFTLSRSSGSATFQGLTAGLMVEAGTTVIFETDPLLSLSATPATGNNTFTSTPKVFNVTPSQSLLASAPYTQSIGSESWGFFTGVGQAILDVTLLARAATNTETNVTKLYGNMFAPTSLTLRYTYSTDPSPVPEPGQVAASLLLLGGIGGYIFIKRRRAATPAAA
jgi:hypothetical protein